MSSIMGTRIKQLRLARGLNQTELGEVIGITKSTMAKYERGDCTNMKQPQIKKLADYFGVSPAWLMGLEETDEQDEIDELLEDLRNDPSKRMLFSVCKDATKEDILKAVAIIEALKKTNG